MSEPKRYFDALTRLHELGVGEGVPKYIDNDLTIEGEYLFHWGDDPKESTWVRNDEAATLILEAQLLRDILSKAERVMFENGEWWINMDRGSPTINSATLLDASDAVIKYLEDSRE